MVIEITEMTLKRLTNYESIVLKDHLEVEKLQWRVMILKVMQAAEKAKSRASQVSTAVTYARYLYRLQTGQDHTRYIYGEPLLSQSLVDLMKELSIEQRMVPAAESEAVMRDPH